jgi:hypothetical protein
MKTVEGEFEHLDFHDSIVKYILFGVEEITIDLSFAHIFDEHSQNQTQKVVCAKDCQLVFSEVIDSVIQVYSEEQKQWMRLDCIQQSNLLGDVVETEVISPGHYKLSGMTVGSQWMEWLLKAGKVKLRWEVEGESWLTRYK